MQKLLFFLLVSVILCSCQFQKDTYRIKITVHTKRPSDILVAKNVLEKRLRYYSRKPFKVEANIGFIYVTVSDTTHWSSLKSLLTDNADVSLYEAYDLPELMLEFNKANELLASSKKNTLDTLKLNGMEIMKRKFQSENPLFALLNISIDSENNPVNSPVFGYVSQDDTSKLVEFLRSEELKFVFPDNIQFLFSKGRLSTEAGTVFYSLYALRNSKPLPINPYILNVKSDMNNLKQAVISVQLDKDGAFYFQRLTRMNIEKSIAIVSDQQVLSSPRVNSEISGGHFEIAGISDDYNYTKSMAAVLANPISNITLSIKSVDKIRE